MSSHFVDTHQDVSYPGSVMSLHSHTFTELLFCRNSCGAEYLVGPYRYRLQQGDIIMIPPGVSHRPLLPEEMSEPYRRDVLWLSDEFMLEMKDLLSSEEDREQEFAYLFRTAGTRWESLGEIFRTGVLESERRYPGWEAAVIGNTIYLLAQLRRALLDKSTHALAPTGTELLDEVVRYLEEHLADRITLSEIARTFYVSEATITLTFRKKLGTSLYRFLTQRRLIAAKTLIQEGLLLESVGEAVGFADYSSFYRAFKQAFGISPREYRRMFEGS